MKNKYTKIKFSYISRSSYQDDVLNDKEELSFNYKKLNFLTREFLSNNKKKFLFFELSLITHISHNFVINYLLKCIGPLIK